MNLQHDNIYIGDKRDYSAELVHEYLSDPIGTRIEYGKELVIQAHINYLNKKLKFYDNVK